MKPNIDTISDSLQKTSNTIFGFLVIQSLLLSYQLNKQDFVDDLWNTPFCRFYILIGHSVLLAGGIVAMIILSNKIRKYMEPEVIAAVNPKTSLFIKILIMLYFGIIPILVLSWIITTNH